MDKTTNSNNKYWQSLEQWRNDPEFQSLVSSEFMSSPISDGANVTAEDGPARRSFLKLMGASMALTTFGCVRRPAQKIVPYVNRPQEVTPGIANYYASSFADGTESFGTVVTTREGRPIKIEGNPSDPLNNGGMSARAHSHVLSLYDPDRTTAPKKNLLNEKRTNKDTITTTWTKADKEILVALKKGNVALLTGSVTSPSVKSLIGKFKSAFSADHYSWDGSSYGHVIEGQKASYGTSVLPRLRLDRAQYILTIDTDILGTYLSPTAHTADFAVGRKKLNKDMNKLTSFESLMSLTGTNADERYVISAADQVPLALALVHEVVYSLGYGSSYDGLKAITSPHHSAMMGKIGEGINQAAKDLVEYRGKSLVVAGGEATQGANANALQVAVNLLNSILGNDGRTVDYKYSHNNVTGSELQMASLVNAMNKGEIKTLVIQGVNPVYAWHGDFRAASAKVGTIIYVGDRNDETGSIAHYLLNESHPLESWGDLELTKGVFSVQQPTIRPLYNSRSFADTLVSWLNESGSGFDYKNAHNYIKSYWSKNLSGMSWSNVLQNGVYDTSKSERAVSFGGRSFNSSALSILKKVSKGSDLQLVLYSTVGLRDGSLSNVSWLQEFPDPVTKICWDNYATVSMSFADKHKLHEGDIAELTVGDKTLKVPVHIQPGQSSSVIGLALGYGRWATGEVGNKVGVRALDLSDGNMSGMSVSFKKTGKKSELANVQGHHSMEGRQIVVDATLDDYMKNPEANIHRHKIISLWSKHKYNGRKWGLSVDLNSCTGCGSCIIACQSENNTPTVGKKYILKGREMSWMRIDRYYVGDPDSPATVHMPVMCMHCDNAPCETVCPVVATVHSDEGTNDMIYNRCVGTRYCANNCPYKVRRFNWFSYTQVKSPLQMAMNPEVTVRSRGVMEKCTFCTHRIKEKDIELKVAGEKYKDGDVLTACQQSCPADALTFGDMNDPESRVSKAFAEKRTYQLLEELNNTPAVRYRTKIRNVAKLKKDKHQGGGH